MPERRDAAWFTSDVATHLTAVYRYFVRRAARQDADDLTAEVFAIAWRRRDDVPSEAILPWLYRTAGFVLANHRRKAPVFPLHAADEPSVIDHAERIAEVAALGLDETLFARRGPKKTRSWCTSIVDVDRPAQLLDVVEGRTAKAPTDWLEARSDEWRAGISWGVLDLSGPYRKTFTDTLPAATQVADPFHVVKLAGSKLDECRRRVQTETLGHRGRKDDPLYKSRRLLTKGHERLDEKGNDKLMGLLEAGDPHGEVRMTWHAKETLRGFYTQPADEAEVFLDELIAEFADEAHPAEVRSLAKTLRTWRNQILAWHQARVSNGPTEATNNLIKRIKRIGFGFRRFTHYRTRVLLYCGAPDWDLLATVTPR